MNANFRKYVNEWDCNHQYFLEIVLVIWERSIQGNANLSINLCIHIQNKQSKTVQSQSISKLQ